ncbi:10369_t:CDS:2 [Funneliformis geosporum]|nr:10369_t:CDS:2 [Funneliformis geosporum]
METVKDIVIDLKNCEVYIGNNYFLLAPHSVVEKELSCELKPCPIVATRNLDFDEGDIRLIKAEEIPNHDILVGGFPCQTFSIAQSKKENKGLNDPRGHLFKEILRVVEYHKPN